jgi:hypothetical protein
MENICPFCRDSFFGEANFCEACIKKNIEDIARTKKELSEHNLKRYESGERGFCVECGCIAVGVHPVAGDDMYCFKCNGGFLGEIF